MAKLSLSDRIRFFLRLYEDIWAEPYARLDRMEISFTLAPGGTQIATNIPNRGEFESYLARFRQWVSPNDSAYLGDLLEELSRHLAGDDLATRASQLTEEWRTARHPPDDRTREMGRLRFDTRWDLVRLLLYGSGLFHTDPQLAGVWDAIDENHRNLVRYAVRSFEGEVRLIAKNTKLLIEDATRRGLLPASNAPVRDPQ